MRRLLLSLLFLVPILAGCGAASSPSPSVSPSALPSAQRASPQRADLGWVESIGDQSGRLVFGVRSFEVTNDGWRADISLANDTDVPVAVGSADLPGALAFGLMLFSTGAHSELETRNAKSSLPTIRPAETFDPTLPALLRPHQTWAGTIGARGPLAAGTWVRVVFGVLFPGQRIEGGRLLPSKPKVPDSLRKAHVGSDLIWITDHAYELKR
jgi:hypothetical protein